MKPSRGQTLLLSMLMAALALAACTEEAPGPQFANEPAPSRAPTTADVPGTPAALPQATPVPVATPSSFTDLLSTRGAASRVFVTTNDAVWTISSDGEAEHLFEAPTRASILAIDAAPSAQRVAVLIEQASGSRELLALDSSGDEIGRWNDFGAVAATPVAAATPGENLVDWSPQGDRMLVSFRDGSLFEVPVDADEPVVLDVDAGGDRVLQPTWSPTGETIAYIAANDGTEGRSLRLYSPASGVAETVVDPGEGRFVVEFVWMPDGATLLFTEGGELGGAVSGIDLWSIKADGENRKLVASAGTVAPVARISTMRPSPDGRSVAYAVFVPNEGVPRIDSVWVRDVLSGVGYRIPLPSVVAVEDLWWTDEGLAVTVIAGSGRDRGPSLALLLLKPDGAVEALWATPLGAATPAAATPLATPESR